MINSQKVLWEEGMFLTPHHFQQWDRYTDAVLRERVRTIRALDWGVRALKFDEEAVIGGKVQIERCIGVMGNGTFFNAPNRDPVPSARSFKEHFAPKQNRLGVHLAIPVVRSGSLTCSSNGRIPDIPTPLARRTLTLADETRAGSDREIATAVNNIKVLFDGESSDDYQTMKIAEVKLAPTGTYEIAESYVPPCQYTSVSPLLTRILRSVTEILTNKSEDLTGQQRKTGGMGEAARFWLLHTVNTYVPTLLHFHHQQFTHPEQVFLELSRLGAQLCTFAPHQQPKDFPTYDHDDLGTTFGRLEETLRSLLDTVIPTRCIELPLEITGDSLFSASIYDHGLLETARFYISVGADEPQERLIQEIPTKTKVSSRDKVQKLIAMALGGITLRHMPNPPAEIPVQPGRVYFLLEKFGSHWDAIATSRTLSIHIPPDFTDLRLELLAVKD